MMKGIFKFQLSEKEVGFKFGTYALGVACQKDKCSLNNFFQRIGMGNAKKEINLLSLLHLWYGAAVNYYDHINREVDFSAGDVSDWLDEIGYEKINKTYVEALTQFVPKNSTAPTTDKQPVAGPMN